MALFKSGNPALKETMFDQFQYMDGAETMTVNGTINKTGFLLLMLLATSAVSWTIALTSPALVMPVMWGGIIGGLITAIVITFKKEWSAALAPAYALLEGLFLGAISAYFNAAMPGIVVDAILLTMGVFIGMLILYRTQVIKVTETFKMVVVSATMGIAIFYLVALVMRMFGVNVPMMHEGGTLGIVFSLVVVGIAALNLALDFDFIEKGVDQRAPKFMEWYAAFGLMVTIVWLYIEILRLLSKLRSR